MFLHNVNLNLIPVLRELLHHRSITDAGLALGRSPSAISQGLTQLRGILDDPLLVRSGSRMILTPRAESLIDPVEHAYSQMEKVLQVERFDPSHADRLFVIASIDYYVFVFGPTIIKTIQAVAPGVRVRFIDLGRELLDQLNSRYVDFAMMPQFHLAELASERMQHRAIAQSASVALMRKGHPLAASETISQQQLCEFPHVSFHPSWEALGRRSTLLINRQPFHVVAYTSNTAVLPRLVQGTDYVSLVPEELGRALEAELGLVVRPLSFTEELVHSILAWSAIQEADVTHRWIRDTICQAITDGL